MARPPGLLFFLWALAATLVCTMPTLTPSMDVATMAAEAIASRTSSVEVFRTTLAALPLETVTTRLSGDPPMTAPFLPIIKDMVVNNQVSYTLSGPEVFCWYPISGSYGVLPRVLFYLALMTALLARRRSWLYVGALVVALTYSGSAAIQAIMEAFVGRSVGDLDLLSVYTVIGLSAVLAVPLLNWREMVRSSSGQEEDLDDHRPISEQDRSRDLPGLQPASRPILMCWICLVAFAFVCIFAITVPYWLGPGERAWSPYQHSTSVNLQCTPPNGKFNYTQREVDNFLNVVVTQEFSDANDCLNPCHQLGTPFTLFRWTTDLVPLRLDDLVRFGGYSGDTPRHNDRLEYVFYALYPLIFSHFFCQGIYAAIFGRRAPSQARNLTYAVLTRLRFGRGRSPLDPSGRRQRLFGKILAQIVYFWALFIFFIAVPIAGLVIISSEVYLMDLPEAQHSSYISQWLPWTQVVLVLLGALIARFHDHFLCLITLSVYKISWLSQHPSWIYAQYWEGRAKERSYNANAKSIFTGDMESMPDHGLYRRAASEVIRLAADQITTLFLQVWQMSLFLLYHEWQQLKAFWHDPESTRGNQGGSQHQEERDCQCASSCFCPEVFVKERCRHEEGACIQGRSLTMSCPHYPTCEHTAMCLRTRVRKQRSRLLRSRRRTVAMMVSPLHGGVLELDSTHTPVPVQRAANYRRSRDEHLPMETSESEMDEKLAAGGTNHLTRNANQLSDMTSPSFPGQMRRMLSRRSNALGGKDRYRPPARTQPSYESHVTNHSELEVDELAMQQQKSRTRNNTFGTAAFGASIQPPPRETPIPEGLMDSRDITERPALRPSFVAEPSIHSRSRSLVKELPDTQRSMGVRNLTAMADSHSQVSGASGVSPMGLGEASSGSRADDLSPELPRSYTTDSSSRLAKDTPPVQSDGGWDEEDGSGAVRSLAGLTTSFERGIMSRHRRSQVYKPSHLRERPHAGTSDPAPIPTHTEVEQTGAHIADEPKEGFTDTETETDMGSDNRSDLQAQDDGNPYEETSSIAQTESVPPSETPPPSRKRHIAELVQFLPGPKESSGIFLSEREKHKLLDPPSGASTPAIQLPPLSPPDPNSNVARAGNLSLLSRSPHLSLASVMFTSRRQSLASTIRASDRRSGATSDRASGATSHPRFTGSSHDTASGSSFGAERQPGSRSLDHSSTVDYLQVKRPTTMEFADEIVLRKDEFGQYRVVMNGHEAIREGRRDYDGGERGAKSGPSTGTRGRRI